MDGPASKSSERNDVSLIDGIAEPCREPLNLELIFDGSKSVLDIRWVRHDWCSLDVSSSYCLSENFVRK